MAGLWSGVGWLRLAPQEMITRSGPQIVIIIRSGPQIIIIVMMISIMIRRRFSILQCCITTWRTEVSSGFWVGLGRKWSTIPSFWLLSLAMWRKLSLTQDQCNCSGQGNDWWWFFQCYVWWFGNTGCPSPAILLVCLLSEKACYCVAQAWKAFCPTFEEKLVPIDLLSWKAEAVTQLKTFLSRSFLSLTDQD